jgi:4-carboxymuconolactone decarboxylase
MMRSTDTARGDKTTMHGSETAITTAFDAATRQLVRCAAVVAGGPEGEVRRELADAVSAVPGIWMEELLLQTYLFAGFPRALNALREWRRLVPLPSEATAPDADVDRWEEGGIATCKRVYGSMYEKLRANVAALHPAIDAWMILEGYGKVLSRPGLDLGRRELCIVAACVASGQDRQLHSHLHGAVNVGVANAVIEQSLEALTDLIPAERINAARMLFARVVGK